MAPSSGPQHRTYKSHQTALDPSPSPVGARRRLRALAARAWWPDAIERATGLPAAQIHRGLDGYDITPDLAAAVSDAYERLWDRNPPIVGPQDRQAADEARAQAASRNWAPPMAWDDDQIDLPHGSPAKGWKPRRSTRRAVDLVEDAEFLREHGGLKDASVREVAIRLGVTRERLAQAYVRSRRYAESHAEADLEAEAS